MKSNSIRIGIWRVNRKLFVFICIELQKKCVWEKTLAECDHNKILFFRVISQANFGPCLSNNSCTKHSVAFSNQSYVFSYKSTKEYTQIKIEKVLKLYCILVGKSLYMCLLLWLLWFEKWKALLRCLLRPKSEAVTVDT